MKKAEQKLKCYLSMLFGKNYKIGFVILFAMRLITIILLSISNAETLLLDGVAKSLFLTVCLLLSGYLFYSVKRYFSFDRAFGYDHFYPEEARRLSFVREGIFKWTPNAMYVFGFLFLYVPGLIFLSKAAILVVFFNHLFIWVHYYCTERPDIDYIYGGHQYY